MVGTSERVGAVVSVRSMGGLSVFDPKGPIDAARAGAFASRLEDARHVADTLIRLGFDITNFHSIAISFNGTPQQFKDVFGVRLEKTAKPGGRGRTINVYTPDAQDAPRLLDLPKVFDGRAEGIAIACPPKLIDDAGLPVRGVCDDRQLGRCLPDELAMSIWGDGLASLDATGDGIVAAVIGTGHYRHRFFAERHYRVLPTLLGPNQIGSLRDDHGHGTGEAACLFAAAPNLRLRPVKGLLDPVGDMLMVIESLPKPDLIVNSWGYDVDHRSWDDLKAEDLNLHNYLRLLEVTMARAVADGIVVTATAPRTWQSFPTSHPDVLAIGAATDSNMMTACDMPIESSLYPGRQIPDFWSRAGDTGDLLTDTGDQGFSHPSQPGSTLCKIGTVKAGATDDGWAWCDLNQASFPLAASMIAVLLERYRGLPSSAIKALMAEATGDLATVRLAKVGGGGFGGLTTGVGLDSGAAALAVNDHLAALATSVEPDAVKVGALS